MTKITLKPPSVGEKDTVAEPAVTTALKEVEKFLNEKNIETTDNLKKEGIAEESLSKALQEKFTVRLGFVVEKVNASLEAVNEKYYLQEKSGSTITLPKPTANRIIAMYAATATAIKVTASEGKIIGDYFEGVTAELAPNQHLALVAEGFNWRIFAGEPKRTATYSAPKTYTKAEAEAGIKPSATRMVHVTTEINEVGVVQVGGHEVARGVTKNASFLVPPGQEVIATSELQSFTTLLL